MDWSSLLPPYVPVRLPSNGKFYTQKELQGGWIKIREYAAPEESLISSANRDNMQRVISAVLAKCVEGDFDIGILTSEDAYFLLIWLRINSYSSDYEVVELTCPNCDSKLPSPYTIDLSKLEVAYLEDNVKEPLEILLPKTGLKVSLKVIRRADEVAVQDRAVEYLQFRGVEGDPVDALRRAYSISKIVTSDGEEVIDRPSIEDLCVNVLYGSDSLYIDTELEKFTHGVDPNILVDCKRCSGQFPIIIPPTIEFFRPSRFIQRSEDNDASGDLGSDNVWKVRQPILEDSDSQGPEDIDTHDQGETEDSGRPASE